MTPPSSKISALSIYVPIAQFISILLFAVAASFYAADFRAEFRHIKLTIEDIQGTLREVNIGGWTRSDMQTYTDVLEALNPELTTPTLR